MLKKKKTTASDKLVLVKSVRRTRGHRIKSCVQRGLGATPSTSVCGEMDSHKHCLPQLCSLSNKKANDGRLLAPTVSSPSSNDQSIQSTLSDRRQTVSSFHQEPS